ncbi:HEAVY METAL TRANSPORT/DETOXIFICATION SUPERFAMILY PROTEIN [Salix purpurea]|uniref:HEAVY METAL TRANSPORT/DETOXIFICATION SUPERFAMILY PROTEIN n=2 Tax=Salix purpurea TaxID=77065 RepID=A0A9Q0Q576_SALPP|nr:HEAVY METAL TRANSPORT/DETOXIFICATION SUPERFAMILY PROTEIN [Salix purpurea]
MVETQVTTMVIKVVDLGCEKCHKKIKKILCKIPQIQSQIYVEKENTVTITVVCCSPEKIKRKILRKGCGFIECVVIKPPPQPKPDSKPDSKTSKPDSSPKPDSSSKTSKQDSSSKQTPPPPPPIKHEVNVTIRNTCCNECNEGSCGPWCHCHSMSQPPRWVPYSRPPCVPWEDGFCSCRRRGYVVCICEDHSSSCTIM